MIINENACFVKRIFLIIFGKGKRRYTRDGIFQFIGSFLFPTLRAGAVFRGAQGVSQWHLVFLQSDLLCLGRTGICHSDAVFYLAEFHGGICGGKI